MRTSSQWMFGGLSGRPRRGRRRPKRLGVEPLEQRRVLALFVSGPFGWAAGFEAGPTGDPATVSNNASVAATAVDTAGHMYVTGSFTGNVDFDPSSGTSPLTASSPGGMFVAKYSPQGALQWVRGVTGAWSNSIAVTSTGSVVVGGSYSESVDFDPGQGTQTFSATSGRNGFVLMLSAAGDYSWNRSFGPVDNLGYLDVWSVMVDANNTLYVAGDMAGHDSVNGATMVTSGFVRRLDGSGNDVWVRTFAAGPASTTSAFKLQRDGSGGIHVLGDYSEPIDLDPGAGVVMAPNGPQGGSFIVRLTTSGLYSRSVAMPGTNDMSVMDAAVAADGSLYVGGLFTGTLNLETLFGPSASGVSITPAGGTDGFLVKLTPAGGLSWARTYGSLSNESVTRVATNAAGTVFVGGQFGGALDFDAGPGAAVLAPTGTSDAFLLRLGAGGGFSTVRHYGSPGVSTDFGEFALGSNGGVCWSGRSEGVALNVDPEGTGATLQRSLVGGIPPVVGTFFARESFAPGTFVPSGVKIYAVEFGSTATGYALRVNGKVTQVKLGANNASASRPGNGWVALGARQEGPGYELLWRNTRNASYYAWVLDANGVYRHGFDVTLEDIHELEDEYTVDITGDGVIGVPEFTPSGVTVGSVEFGSTDLGYALREGDRVIHVTGPKGHASEQYVGGGWIAFGARRNGPGYEVLWNHPTLGYFSWTLDAFGRYLTGRSVTLPEIYDLESLYGFDITDDGSIGRPFTSANVTIEGVEFGTTGLGYALRVDGKVIQVTFPGGNASASNPADGGVALGARRSNDAFELLWFNPRTATYYGWTLDATGAFRTRFDIQLPEVYKLETLYNVDITGEGTIGPIKFTPSGVKIGVVEFGSTLLGYAMRVNKQVLQVTFPGGYANSRNQNGWVALGARKSGSGYEVLWRNQQATAYFGWTVDAFGRYTSGRTVSLAEVHSLEKLHGIDITGEGTIGPPGA